MGFCEDYPELCDGIVQEAYGRQVTPDDYGLYCDPDTPEGRSMTKQSMRDEVNINNIVARYVDTGFLPQIENLGVFADVSELGDYRSVVDRVNEVGAVFANLPAQVRAAFENDAANFVDFMGSLEDPANLARAKELGLVEREGDVIPPGGKDEVPPGSAGSAEPVA